MNPYVIQTDRLTRYFASTCAVDQISLSVPRGAVCALLGRNGSGKSTLVRMLMGMLIPTRGSATILDNDIRKISPQTRARIGYIAEGHPLIDWMRVRDLESFQKSFYPNWDAHLFRKVTDHFALQPRARAHHLSRGQRAGLSLALVLATRPELLIMDDPALGLDPVARRTLLEAMILMTRDAGHTIFFTSHELVDVERVADYLAIIDRSILRVCCPLEVFRNRISRIRLTFAASVPQLPILPGLLESKRDGRTLTLLLADPNGLARSQFAALSPLNVEGLPVSLEDAILAYLRERTESATLLQESSFAEANP
jgi:ABC-2 type transport system ATP-binding protein